MIGETMNRELLHSAVGVKVSEQVYLWCTVL
jgi:hypothetical protein